MIYNGKKEVSGIYYQKKVVTAVYYQGKLIWSKGGNINSCFAKGFWDDKEPWTDNLAWADSNK